MDPSPPQKKIPSYFTATGRPLSGRRSRILKKKVLFPAEEAPGPVSTEVWSTEENKSLVELVLLHGDPQCGLVIA